MVQTLARQWAGHLAAWAIPEEILARAPESPWGFPVELFRRSAEQVASMPPSPSHRRAREAVPSGGVVLDVGAGGGAASIGLAPPAGRLVAVDESERMLESFAGLAASREVAFETVLGRWPDVAAQVEPADVVVCHHVLYNVPDIEPFIAGLHDHARHRVVIEITSAHPQSDLNPLWLALHGIERPERPVAEDAIAVLEAMGFAVSSERTRRPPAWAQADRSAQVAFARKRLCVGPERDPEIDRLLDPPERELVTIWWDR